MQHEINTTADFEPRRTRAYRVPELLKGEIERQIDELLHLDFIEGHSDLPGSDKSRQCPYIYNEIVFFSFRFLLSTFHRYLFY